jgi:hypothetical protein
VREVAAIVASARPRVAHTLTSMYATLPVALLRLGTQCSLQPIHR